MPPKEADDNYSSSLNGEIIMNENTPDAVPHYACPSCWTCHSDFEWIKKHMFTDETQGNISSIPIKTKKGAFFFRDTSTALHPPKRPRITSENIFTLSPVATIINPYNEHLLSEQKRFARQQIADQANMVSLKQYPTAYNMLKQALDVELPNLPHFL
ncbi:hypothetical protein G6F56_000950 [Rhizopus delemar]|uniref:Uncharacterized protein n=1 Tax=Rhizopus stolonifer TaxID=4846 RepID=A0A367KXJ2_RHIST|nr:hypothetical protein G6F56_000950 [Rhizopus delemar]RCI06905.1 hypothetical protein CU098_013939 [Rhizopus stolonifer]